jgi:hypothetical protein
VDFHGFVMRIYNKQIVGMVLLSLAAQTCALASDLKTFKSVYGKNTEEIRTSYKSRFDGLQVMYLNALQSFQAQVQAKGDLVATKAAIAEIDRFKKAKCLPAETRADEVPEIRKLQAAYVGQFNRLEVEMLARLSDLAAKYDQALERLQKNLTRALKLEEATAVMEERQKVKGTIEDFNALRAALLGGQVDSQATSGEAQSSDVAMNADSSPAATPVNAADSGKDTSESAPDVQGKKVTVYVDAKTIGRGGNMKLSSDKVRNMTCEVSVRMTSFDIQNAPVKVIVFFVGRDRGKRLLVAEKQEREVMLEKTRGWVDSFTSKDIRENAYYHYFDYEKNDKQWFDGAKLQGWIVQVWSGDQLVGKAASLNQLIRYAESQDVVKEIGLILVEQ